MAVPQQQIQEAVQKLSNTFLKGFDPISIQNFVEGVSLRVSHAVDNGEELTQELVIAAVMHWHESSKRFHQDLLDNKDGMKDKLMNDVYHKLRAK